LCVTTYTAADNSSTANTASTVFPVRFTREA
jgi:hypothetical protein